MDLKTYRDLLHELYMFLQGAKEAYRKGDLNTYTEYLICADEVNDEIKAFEFKWNNLYTDFSS